MGVLSAGKWCISHDDVINCIENSPAASSWSLTGNEGINPAENFLGTIDNQPVELRVAGIRALRIERHPTDPSLSPNIIAGDIGNTVYYNVIGATIGGGGEVLLFGQNLITDNFGTIGGGRGNVAGFDDDVVTSNSHATVGGGRFNMAQGMYATIGGGSYNVVSAKYGTIAGGGESQEGNPDSRNRVTDDYGTIGGGGWNQAGDNTGTTEDAHFATVSGGLNNIASGNTSTVSGGFNNNAGGALSSIGGGDTNQATGEGATVSGGFSNTAIYSYGTVGGGYFNQASSIFATVGGGRSNQASGSDATAGGGLGNQASGEGATVGGGVYNNASGSAATVAGGNNNYAYANATVGGGNVNQASGYTSTIGGGYSNQVSGDFAAVPGGMQARASHYGQKAYASGSFDSPGSAQASLYVLRTTTSNATQTELFLNQFSERITIEPNQTMTFDILVAARSSTGNSAGYRIAGVIENDGGNVRMVESSPIPEEFGEEVGSWNAIAEEDNVNDALVIKVTGDSSIIRWVATVRTAEVAWPAP